MANNKPELKITRTKLPLYKKEKFDPATETETSRPELKIRRDISRREDIEETKAPVKGVDVKPASATERTNQLDEVVRRHLAKKKL